jgi:hypothetical protein
LKSGRFVLRRKRTTRYRVAQHLALPLRRATLESNDRRSERTLSFSSTWKKASWSLAGSPTLLFCGRQGAVERGSGMRVRRERQAKDCRRRTGRAGEGPGRTTGVRTTTRAGSWTEARTCFARRRHCVERVKRRPCWLIKGSLSEFEISHGRTTPTLQLVDRLASSPDHVVRSH